jgi:hypothetical protein
MEVKFLGVPMFAWSALCLLVALVFVVIWPADRAAKTSGLLWTTLRWGHAIVWVLLALSCFVWGFGELGPASMIAALAGVVYLAFIYTVVTSK